MKAASEGVGFIHNEGVRGGGEQVCRQSDCVEAAPFRVGVVRSMGVLGPEVLRREGVTGETEGVDERAGKLGLADPRLSGDKQGVDAANRYVAGTFFVGG